MPLVTGAAGFAGRHLVEHLAAHPPGGDSGGDGGNDPIVGWARTIPAGATPGVSWQAIDLEDRDAVRAAVRSLKDDFDGELQVPGSHRLVQELIASDLVDQINLMVFPVILGTGKKAFEETPERRNLRLSESKVVGEGVAVLVYERAA